jgi:hypothetical protein
MMPQLDALDENEAAFLASLASLPGSYDGPDGVRQPPYGLVAFGEAAALPLVLRPWIDGSLVAEGTQFLISTGFDFGEIGPLKLVGDVSGAQVVTLGSRLNDPDLEVAPGPFSLYTICSYLGHATGHHQAIQEFDAAARTVAERCGAHSATENNPAKALAWTLWNRVPLLLASRTASSVPALVQRVFARTGKSLAIAVGEHPLEFASGALEGKHAFGDDLLALLIGGNDAELELAREVLSTRVAQVERLDLSELLPAAPADPVATALTLWYLSLWVAAYLAILHGHDPADSGVYLEARTAAEEG